MIASCVSHYRILEKLGAGGMGEVYAAEDTLLARRVAVKFPSIEKDEGGARTRFLAEARAASRLDHPNIARIYDYGEAPDGRPFLVMELVNGKSLREMLRQGRLPVARSAEIAKGVLRALAEAHRRGLAHRDIKPGNVMLTESGDVKVLDFGVAKEILAVRTTAVSAVETASIGSTAAGALRGTPEYMSPEQARGEVVDHRSDLFSAGLVLYECVTGRRAFSGATAREALDRVLHGEPPPPSSQAPSVPAALDRITAKALAKAPTARYQSAAEMIADLDAMAAALGASRRRQLRARLPWLAGAAGALALAAGLLLWEASPYQPPPEALRWYERGAVALRDGTYNRAAKSLQKAIEIDPRFVLARARLAEARNELDDAQGAKEEMLRAVPAGGGRAARGRDALYVQAVHATLAGDFPSAIQTLTGLVEQAPDPERSAVLVDLGRARERNGETAKAVDAYREAIRRDMQNAAAHLRLAILLGRQQKPEAAAEFGRAEALYQSQSNTEGQVEVYYQRGLLASDDPRRAPEARAALERAIALSKAISTEYQEVAATLQLSAVTFVEGNPAMAESIASAAVARARAGGMAYLEARGLTDLGNARFMRGDYAHAEANYREALTTARRYRYARAEARALIGLANLHQSQGAADAAIEEGKAAAEYYERGGFRLESVKALTILARAYRDMGRNGDALAAFERILALAGAIDDRQQMGMAEQGTASVLMRQDRLPEALAHYIRYHDLAVSARSRGAIARSLLSQADVLGQLGRFAEAERALDEAEPLTRDGAGALAAPMAAQGRAELALFRSEWKNAAALARRSMEMPGLYAPSRAWSGCLAGLALARSGEAKAGTSLCRSALNGLAASGQSLTAPLRVAMAEILLANGDPRAAAEEIRSAVDLATASSGYELLWRAWALAARIYRRAGEPDRAREAAGEARRRLLELRSGWGAADAASYLARPDIRRLADEILQ